MEVIKKSDILDSYNYNGYSGGEIIGMIVYGEIPTVKAIPLDNIKRAIKEIQKLRGLSCNCSDGIIDDVEEILDKLIESEGE